LICCRGTEKVCEVGKVLEKKREEEEEAEREEEKDKRNGIRIEGDTKG